MAIAVFAAACVVTGILAQKHAYPKKIKTFVMVHLGGTPTVVSHEQRITNIHTLDITRVALGDGLGGGGGLAELAGNILFASSKGRFGYRGVDNQYHALDIQAPMNIEALRKSSLIKDPLFDLSGFRVADLLATQVDHDTFRLFVSHHRYDPNCMEFKVSSILLKADENGIRPVTTGQAGGDEGKGRWEDVFIARPHCIRSKDRSWPFVGEQSGGRMVQVDDHTILLSIGDHQFDGFNDAWKASMDPEADLGKIIEIDLRTHESHIYASGMRNPQGLLLAHDGRIWETEHGPQGGDEVNLVTEGANFGWPQVTYGMNYGYPRRTWPFDPIPGAHEGYTKPTYAFVPSVGISNIVEPDVREFPGWRNSLIVASMRG
jgi:hypothetical protein